MGLFIFALLNVERQWNERDVSPFLVYSVSVPDGEGLRRRRPPAGRQQGQQQDGSANNFDNPHRNP